MKSVNNPLIKTSPLLQCRKSTCPHCNFLFLRFNGTEFQQIDLPDELRSDLAWCPKLGNHPWLQIMRLSECHRCKGQFLDCEMRTIVSTMFKTIDQAFDAFSTTNLELNARKMHFDVHSPLATFLGARSPWLGIRLELEGFKAEIHRFPLLPLSNDPRSQGGFTWFYAGWVRRFVQRFYTPFQRIGKVYQ